MKLTTKKNIENVSKRHDSHCESMWKKRQLSGSSNLKKRATQRGTRHLPRKNYIKGWSFQDKTFVPQTQD